MRAEGGPNTYAFLFSLRRPKRYLGTSTATTWPPGVTDTHASLPFKETAMISEQPLRSKDRCQFTVWSYQAHTLLSSLRGDHSNIRTTTGNHGQLPPCIQERRHWSMSQLSFSTLQRILHHAINPRMDYTNVAYL